MSIGIATLAPSMQYATGIGIGASTINQDFENKIPNINIPKILPTRTETDIYLNRLNRSDYLTGVEEIDNILKDPKKIQQYAEENNIKDWNDSKVKEDLIKKYESNNKNNNNNEEEENKTPLPPTPSVTEQESTGTQTPEEEQQGNVDKEFQQMLDLAKQEKYENWKREDEIRLETQAREDSAYRRMVRDMRLAGINPNLINATPSASGGGITNATKKEEILGNQIATISNELINAIKNDTTVSNNWKDNAFKTVQSFISLIGSYLIGKGLKK